MRGKHNDGVAPGARIGLIPAHAGKTDLAPVVVSMRGAHPRACGENGIVVASFGRVTGSSPRMRGKQFTQRGDTAGARLIPAHAGKTLTR